MNKEMAIESLLGKSDLGTQEKELMKSALVTLVETKANLGTLKVPADRSEIQMDLNKSLNDSIAYLCMMFTSPDVVVGREINCFTGISTENIGS